jgi:hypothetical protein
LILWLVQQQTVSELTLLYFLEQQQFHLIEFHFLELFLTNWSALVPIVGLALSNSFTVIPYFLAIFGFFRQNGNCSLFWSEISCFSKLCGYYFRWRCLSRKYNFWPIFNPVASNVGLTSFNSFSEIPIV